jgi:outer membrane protein TolC
MASGTTTAPIPDADVPAGIISALNTVQEAFDAGQTAATTVTTKQAAADQAAADLLKAQGDKTQTATSLVTALQGLQQAISAQYLPGQPLPPVTAAPGAPTS